MRAFQLLVIVALLGLAGCSSSAPAPQQPTPQPAPAQPTARPPVPTATSAPTATPAPPTLAPSPTATTAAAVALPDPKQDPLGALLHASSPKSWRTATLTYTLDMKMAPVDGASSQSLGALAQQLADAKVQGTGSGAMEITDQRTGKANMKMHMDVAAAGQNFGLDMVTVNGETWTRTGDGPWQKMDRSSSTAKPPANDAQNMLEALRQAKDVQYVASETLDGEAVHHLRFSLDPSQMDLASALAGAGGVGSGALQGLMEGNNINVDVWLTTKDLLVRQEKISTAFKMPVPTPAQIQALLDMTMRFDQFNAPVQIAAPEGPQGAGGNAQTGTCPAPAAGTRLLNNQDQGYCTLFPDGYTTQAGDGQTVLFVDSLQDVAHARANIEVLAAGGRTARAAANEALSRAKSSVPGLNVTPKELPIGGEQAVALDGMPGQDLNRQVFVVHNDRLFKLTFVPSDPAEGDRYSQMQKLYDTVTKSWAFLP